MNFDSLKPWLFCLLLTIFWFPAAAIMISVLDFSGFGESVRGESIAIAIVETAPFIVEDISLFGEASPFFVAGLLTILAPKKGQRKFISAAICLCAIGWLINLGFSVFLGRDGNANTLATVLIGTGTEDAAGGDVNSYSGLSVLSGFATGSRVFYLVVAASLIGISIRKEG